MLHGVDNDARVHLHDLAASGFADVTHLCVQQVLLLASWKVLKIRCRDKPVEVHLEKVPRNSGVVIIFLIGQFDPHDVPTHRRDAVLDAGVATCWKSDTGVEQWKQRLEGTFTASPVLVGDQIFATNETGTTWVFKASPAGFEQVAENKLAEEVFATPTICHSRIYLRGANTIDGKRQESLYCLGSP